MSTYGWGGGIRTPECWYQKPVPYHLATPHYFRILNVHLLGVSSYWDFRSQAVEGQRLIAEPKYAVTLSNRLILAYLWLRNNLEQINNCKILNIIV